LASREKATIDRVAGYRDPRVTAAKLDLKGLFLLHMIVFVFAWCPNSNNK
jgi:hypothetical protein